ncbi:MAG: ribose-phosphate diphosphokinase [Desulfurococcales archaeon]|nr:ribose-phosphate diphosphokinase [Desulfurococcales archaeon]
MYSIIPLSGDPGIGERIAWLMGGNIVGVFTKDHPDGELYLRLEGNMSGKKALIVQSMYPMQDRRFVELLLAIDAAIRGGASEIDLLISYLAYARQDKVFIEGEPVSVNAILRSIKDLGVNKVFVVEPHSSIPRKIYGEGFFEIDGVTPLASRFQDEGELVIISPDLGGIERAWRLASKLPSIYGVYYIEKQRDRYTGEVRSSISKEIDLRDKNALIVDDIISTGGTIANAARLVIERGASKVYVACVHPIFVKGSVERLKESGIDRIVCGKTVKHQVEGVEYIDLDMHIYTKISEILSIGKS